MTLGLRGPRVVGAPSQLSGKPLAVVLSTAMSSLSNLVLPLFVLTRISRGGATPLIVLLTVLPFGYLAISRPLAAISLGRSSSKTRAISLALGSLGSLVAVLIVLLLGDSFSSWMLVPVSVVVLWFNEFERQKHLLGGSPGRALVADLSWLIVASGGVLVAVAGGGQGDVALVAWLIGSMVALLVLLGRSPTGSQLTVVEGSRLPWVDIARDGVALGALSILPMAAFLVGGTNIAAGYKIATSLAAPLVVFATVGAQLTMRSVLGGGTIAVPRRVSAIVLGGHLLWWPSLALGLSIVGNKNGLWAEAIDLLPAVALAAAAQGVAAPLSGALRVLGRNASRVRAGELVLLVLWTGWMVFSRPEPTSAALVLALLRVVVLPAWWTSVSAAFVSVGAEPVEVRS